MPLVNHRIGTISATYANLSIMFFQSSRYDLFKKMFKRVGDGRHPCLTLTVVLNLLLCYHSCGLLQPCCGAAQWCKLDLTDIVLSHGGL